MIPVQSNVQLYSAGRVVVSASCFMSSLSVSWFFTIFVLLYIPHNYRVSKKKESWQVENYGLLIFFKLPSALIFMLSYKRGLKWVVILFCRPNRSREIPFLKKVAFFEILIYLQYNEFSKHSRFYKLTIHQAFNMSKQNHIITSKA